MPTTTEPTVRGASTYDLGVNAGETYDAAEAVTLAQACKLVRGRTGPASYEIVCRWATPSKGYRLGNVRVVLPTVVINNGRMTMPAWVAAFERARVAVGAAVAADDQFQPRGDRTRRAGRPAGGDQ